MKTRIKENLIFGKDEPEHFHLARIKKFGESFEVTINPDLAIEFRAGHDIPINDVLLSEEIFNDAKRGLKASEITLKKVFKTDDVLKVAEQIVKEGEIQLSQEYKEKLRNEKRKRIAEIIHVHGINSGTGKSVPLKKIEELMEQENVTIEDERSAEDHVKDVLKELAKVMQIKFEMDEIEIQFSPEYSTRGLPYLKHIASVVENTWNKNGTLTCVIHVPAGMVEEILAKVNEFAHGDIKTSIKKVREQPE